MITTNNPSGVNLRGVLINPANQPSINYYLCLIDLPKDMKVGEFEALPPQSTNEQAVRYKYHGILPAEAGTAFETHALPIYTYQGFPVSEELIVIDDNQKILKIDVGARGLNRIKPPIVGHIDPDEVKCTSFAVESRTQQGRYFIVTMAFGGSGVIPLRDNHGFDRNADLAVAALEKRQLSLTLRLIETRHTEEICIGVVTSDEIDEFRSVYARIPLLDAPDEYRDGPVSEISYTMPAIPPL